MYEGDAITFLTNEHDEPVTLFLGKRRADEFIDSVTRAGVAIHAHPWKGIAPHLLRKRLLVEKGGRVVAVR